MRKDIKFRGIGKADKKWIYGDLRIGGVYKDNPAIIDHRLGDDDIDAEISLSPEVYPDTIGQYVGFKDANGKEVYEHDIIKYGNLLLEVTYNEKCGGFCAVLCDNGAEEWCPTLGTVFGKNHNAFVIGNRFNHPELISSFDSKDKEHCFTADNVQQAMKSLGFDKEQITNVINYLTSHEADR